MGDILCHQRAPWRRLEPRPLPPLCVTRPRLVLCLVALLCLVVNPLAYLQPSQQPTQPTQPTQLTQPVQPVQPVQPRQPQELLQPPQPQTQHGLLGRNILNAHSDVQDKSPSPPLWRGDDGGDDDGGGDDGGGWWWWWWCRGALLALLNSSLALLLLGTLLLGGGPVVGGTSAGATNYWRHRRQAEADMARGDFASGGAHLRACLGALGRPLPTSHSDLVCGLLLAALRVLARRLCYSPRV
ncbi:uncharacterized protein LOC144955128 [Lampetra fluviatilis]